MKEFKVICKANGDNWTPLKKPFRIIEISKLFGLIKQSRLEIDENAKSNGPTKEEICIVTNIVHQGDLTVYRIKGYGWLLYDSKWFIRLDEITETQKEIAEKAMPILN